MPCEKVEAVQEDEEKEEELDAIEIKTCKFDNFCKYQSHYNIGK